MLHAQPTMILLSSRIDESVEAHLNPSQQDHSPYVLEIRPSPEFKYDGGKQRLVDIQSKAAHSSGMELAVPGDDDDHHKCGGPSRLDPGFTRRQANLLRLSASVDLDSRLSIGCAGAVLIYLQRRRAVQYLPGNTDADASFRITALETFALNAMM